MSKMINFFCLFLWGFLGIVSFSCFGQFSDWENREIFFVFPKDSLTKIHYNGSNASSNFSNLISVNLAIGEAQSFQLVIKPFMSNLHNIQVEIENNNEGIEIDWRKVEWVKTAAPSYPTSYVGYWPDPLIKTNTFDINIGSVQPLWFTIKVPQIMESGEYTAKVKISSVDYTKTFNLKIGVRDFILPRTLATPFGLYAKKISEWYYGSTDYRTHLSKDDYMKWVNLLFDYRLCPKEIGQEYSHKEPNSVSLAPLQDTMGKIGDMLPPYSYSLFRLPSGSTIENRLETKPLNEVVDEVTAPVLDYWNAWKEQKFPSQVCVYGIDEPEENPLLHTALENIYEIIRQDVPNVKIMQTIGSPAPHLEGLVDIWIPKTSCAWEPFFQQRIQNGDILWNYVCVSPVNPYPNFFIDVPAIEHRILFWQTSKINATGFLYWSVGWYDGFESPASGNPSFPDVRLDFADHCQYSSSWLHVNGDGVLVYPGKNLEPIPSIRLAVIRDGIQDYEYIAFLKKLLKKVGQIPGNKTADEIELIEDANELTIVPDSITSSPRHFTDDKNLVLTRRNQIGNMIEQIQQIYCEYLDSQWYFTDIWKIRNGVIVGGNSNISFLWNESSQQYSEIEFVADITPLESKDTSWKSLSLVINKTDQEYWALSIAEKTDAGGKGHFIELKERWNNVWGAESNLVKLVSENENFDWEYNKTYKLKIKLTNSRIDGFVMDKNGNELSHVAYELQEGNSVNYGKPAFRAQAMKGRFSEIEIKNTVLYSGN